ncbi:RNA polymerase sigma factor [Tundrisphaera sp. TA3]|uniref:RNA polymerase sigma factor n=1 Tax=Tundrisphaera sp. TA3 TaxID=3435775 RepID=UPI003EB8D620
MDDDGVEFAELIARVRAHDEAAIADLLRRFEADVRTMVRVRLPKAMRNHFDSMDFVQAIWTSVLVKKGDEVGEFSDAGKFRGFLAVVARNKVFEEHRRLSTLKYDLGREERLYVRRGEREIPREVRAADPTPSETVQAGERLGQLTEGRSAHEKQVVELRRQGLTFEEIARQLGRDERSIRRIIDDLRKRMEERRWQ